MYDIHGKLLLKKMGHSADTLNLDMKELAGGIYYYQISQQGKLVVMD